ncbi:MAG TPA: nucleotidyltransferase domain-containing protein [Candidatus Nanoarchaeia archaeon]|nr:nucleotidyltransferase domain-containing protein [Candidatus Nanoarchaeia archaeon]
MFKELNILKFFFEDPNREFNIREIAKIAQISPATASKLLKEFKKNKILQYRKERVFDLYKADLNSIEYRDLKIYYNVKKLREFIDALNEFYLKPTIILFGSFSKGLDIKQSDIDLVIISENTKEFPNLKIFEKKLNREIQIFAVKNLKNLKNNHLINNVLNGIILQGEVKWI